MFKSYKKTAIMLIALFTNCGLTSFAYAASDGSFWEPYYSINVNNEPANASVFFTGTSMFYTPVGSPMNSIPLWPLSNRPVCYNSQTAQALNNTDISVVCFYSVQIGSQDVLQNQQLVIPKLNQGDEDSNSVIDVECQYDNTNPQSPQIDNCKVNKNK